MDHLKSSSMISLRSFRNVRFETSKVHTVDGSEIRRSPVEVGSLSHDLHGFVHPRWFSCRISFTNNIIDYSRNLISPLQNQIIHLNHWIQWWVFQFFGRKIVEIFGDSVHWNNTCNAPVDMVFDIGKISWIVPFLVEKNLLYSGDSLNRRAYYFRALNEFASGFLFGTCESLN